MHQESERHHTKQSTTITQSKPKGTQLLKRLLREKEKLLVNNKGVLIRRTPKVDQIVIPPSLRNLVYQELHEKMGNLGGKRVYQLAKERFYWPGMEKDIEDYIKNKCICLSQRKPHVLPQVSLGTVKSSGPMDIVGIDFLKVDKCSGGYEYILVITDHFARYTQIYVTKKKSARTAASKLYSNFILNFGSPERILHDQGPEFKNELFRNLNKTFGISKLHTTPYYPMTNGLVEQMNSTLIQMLRTLTERNKQNWKDKLNKLTYAYNCTRHSVTGFSPFYLMFGRNPRLPIDFFIENNTDEQNTPSTYIEKWKSRMKEAFGIAAANTKQRRDIDKRKRDQKARLQPFEVGGRVLYGARGKRPTFTGTSPTPQ